ncbi:MAG: Gfo/Idh/MocA family oxidoreductase [Treponema sp.]|jgi:predicted dehydrogenase|nr:Gfo/Idh/MocA family oxidoreductase [Treponema sp.]
MKKLALIGCGGIGAYHLDHFLQFTDLDLAGFCDITVERAEGFVKKAGRGRAFADYVEMYDAVKPDMVFICVPPTCHGNIEFETIRRGIPFFVEKPLTLDLDLAREIAAQVEKRGIIAASGFQCRYDNINDAARAYIAASPVLTVQASRVGGIPEVPWWRNKPASGGQLVEQTIHQMDMLRYLLGTEPKTVYSVAGRGWISQEECPGYFTDDLSTTLVTFKNGVTATMMTGCYAKNAVSWDSKMTFGARDSRMDYVLCSSVTVYREGGKAAAAGKSASVIKGDGVQDRDTGEHAEVTKSAVDFGLLCDRTFVDAALSGDPSKIRSPYGDAYKSVAFTLACNRSMTTGLPVDLAY